MKIIICLLLLLSFSIAHAISFGVVDIDELDDMLLVYSTNGQVYEARKELLNDLKFALSEKIIIEAKLTDTELVGEIFGTRDEILSLQLSSQKASHGHFYKTVEIAPIKNTYVTDVDFDQDAIDLFKTMRSNSNRRSQCYNRAHVWAYEMNKKTYQDRAIQLGKQWLFFTRKYIREYRYKWWFHVTPYLTVQKLPIMMDRLFSRTPQEERLWTNMFIRPATACPEVYKYTDYSEHQEESLCYLIKSSLFYWQPYQVQNAERYNQERKEWISSEVRRAYADAFGFGFDDF